MQTAHTSIDPHHQVRQVGIHSLANGR
jgi:hypothetical protein